MQWLLVTLFVYGASVFGQSLAGHQEFSLSGYLGINSATGRAGLRDAGYEVYVTAMAEYYLTDNFSGGVSLSAINMPSRLQLFAPGVYVCGSYHVQPTMLVLYARGGVGYSEEPFNYYLSFENNASITSESPLWLTAAAGCKLLVAEYAALRVEVQQIWQNARYTYYEYHAPSGRPISEVVTTKQLRVNLGVSVIL